MNKYIDVMRQAKDLSDPCLEGLEHIKSRLNQGEFDSTMMMFHDSANARVGFGPGSRHSQNLPKGACPSTR